jgi:DNA (cytosine-5)-methyltransferase 1
MSGLGRINEERAIDLFSGSGAVSAALRRCGFRVIAAVDEDPVACRTYRLNHPSVYLIESDILKVTPSKIVDQYPDAAEVELLVVCAPCQPFSSQNRKREKDGRARLLLEGARFARVLAPKCIFFENVPGLAGPANLAILATLRRRLLKIGYHLGEPRKIDAADLGVPQRRVRCVMIASKHRAALSAFNEAEITAASRTVADAIGELPRLASGERDPCDSLHYARNHQSIVLERLAAIPKDGGSRSYLPSRLRLICHRGIRGFPDVYGRMRWNSVAPTLTTGCDDVTRGRFAHPDQDRAITLREAAMLQTFPRDYAFVGNRRQIATQIGNAVPVAMVEALLPILRQAIQIANS